MEINFKRYSECAKAPLKATKDSTGNDLFLPITETVRARSCELIGTDLQIEFP